MMDFSLHNHDLNTSNGDLSLCSTDTEATAQSIVIRLKTFLGEWFLDENQGLPYLTHIFGRKLHERSIKRLISQEIKSMPSVIDVQELLLTLEANRSIHISFNVILSDQKRISITNSIGVL